MKKRILFAGFFMLIIILTQPVCAQITVSAEDISGAVTGEEVTVAISISGIGSQEVTSIQGTVSWDETILDYQSYTYDQISLTPVGEYESDFSFAWGNPFSETLNEGEFLYLTFQYNGTGGQCSDITFTDNVTARELSVSYVAQPITWTGSQVCGFVCEPVNFDLMPENTETCGLPANASFTIGATGSEPINYHWQYYDGTSWEDVVDNTPTGVTYSGANSEVLTASGFSQIGTYEYRCYADNCGGAEFDVSATAHVIIDASIPGTASEDQNILAGTLPESLTLTDYNGYIQWQYSDNGTDGWTDISGSTSSVLTSNTMGALNADRWYRAAVTSGTCSVEYSNIIHISIANPNLTVSFEDVNGVMPGEEFTITAEISGATDEITSIQGTVSWDETILQYVGYTTNQITLSPAGEYVSDFTFAWGNPFSETLTNGDFLNLTFEFIGNMDECTDVIFSDSVTARELSVNYLAQPVSWQSGQVCASSCFPPEITTQPIGDSVCEGATHSLSVEATGDGLNYQWQRNGSSISNGNNNILNLSNLSTSDSGEYACIVTGDCGTISSDSVLLTVISSPFVNVESSNTLCQGQTIALSETGDDAVSWHWNGPLGFSSTQSNISIDDASVDNTGYYVVNGTNDFGCSADDSVYIEVVAPTSVSISDPGTICSLDASLTLQTNPDLNGYWIGEVVDSISGTIIPSNNVTGIHNISFVAYTACHESDDIDIEILPQLDASIITDADTLLIDESPIDLQALTPGGTWYGEGIHPGTAEFNPENAGLGEHQIWYEIDVACGDIDSITMTVIEIESNEDLVIPDVFTPNGDGYNDTWEITGIQAFESVSIYITTRWGDDVFTYDGTGYNYSETQNQWDGTYNSKQLPSGTYVYILELNNNQSFKGALTIIR